MKFPTYHSLGNHTEALQIDFNPDEISFDRIVELFWKNHNPLRGVRSRQYMAAFWFYDEAQRDAILAGQAAVERRLEAKVETPVLPLDVFYPAEDYHQKYRLQHSPLMDYFQRTYPAFNDFNNSTAAARLNGFVAGHGRRELFEKEADGYGIPRESMLKSVRLPGACASRQCCDDP
jgi:hypothetical protein